MQNPRATGDGSAASGGRQAITQRAERTNQNLLLSPPFRKHASVPRLI
jgi:hypothetical protein